MDDAANLRAFQAGVNVGGIAMTPAVSNVDLDGQTSVTNSHQSPTDGLTTSYPSQNGTSSHGASQNHDMVATVGYPIHDNVSSSSRAAERGMFAQDVTVHGQGQQTQLIPSDFSMPLVDHNHVSPLSNNNLWGASIMSPGPSWLIGYDFDLEALNSASTVPATMEMGEPLFQPHIPFNAMPNLLEPESSSRGGMQRRQRPINDVVKKSWFSQTEDLEEDEEDSHRVVATGQTTPAIGANQYDVDDNFRTRVSLKLKPRTNDDPLPSNNFLNLSVQMYFTKFNTVFPVIHGQTFRPTPKNSLLLLSICSVGSLLIGSKGAAAQGVRIFERLNKAILATWETTVLSDPSEASSMIQAALIGQTFGLLSGDAKHLAIVEAFHGTVVAWARRCNMFRYRSELPQIDGLTGAELDHAWKAWARSEETVRSVVYLWVLQRLLTDDIFRTVLGLYIHDAELASMFHHEPLLRHDAVMVSAAADDSLFNAPTASAWRDQVRLQAPSRPLIHEILHANSRIHDCSNPLSEELICRGSRFTAYVMLHGIYASICEKQQMGHLDPAFTDFGKYSDALMCWYFTFEVNRSNPSFHEASPRSDTFCLMILWHTVFMNLLANFDTLERAIGRDGPDTASASEDIGYAIQWAKSIEARRCILHAHALQNALGTMRLDTEPAIHIPHCLFLAGIASYCFTRFRCWPLAELMSPHEAAVESQVEPVLNFPEFSLRGAPIPKHLFGITSDSMSYAAANNAGGYGADSEQQQHGRQRHGRVVPVGAGMLCTLTDMLQRVGHWGIARKFAGTLGTLVQADTEEKWMLG